MTTTAESAPPFTISAADLNAALASALSTTNGGSAHAITLDPETVQHDVAKLVLTLIEFIRRLLELQAIRRMQAGTLTMAEEERVGMTLMRAGEQIRLLSRQFGIGEGELNLDLGPLGKLM